jgi:response regulator of citrate/malate metabolism
MPDYDGLDLIDSMHVLRYSTPVAVITAQTQAEGRDLAMPKGALGYL